MKKLFNFTRRLLFTNLLLVSGIYIFAQVHPDYTITKQVKTSPIKNQNRTGTCWSFATVSFLETEAIRMGKPIFDLSEMFIAKFAYQDKATKYVRYQGNANFGEGGQAHDVLNEIKKHGIVPEENYTGLQNGNKIHNHQKLFSVLDAYLKNLLQQKNNKQPNEWFASGLSQFNDSLEAYLGITPTDFTYQGKTYDPVKFAKEVVGINPDDYIELTSYKAYPYYKLSDLEIPDNWSHDLYYNVPLSDILTIMDNAINKGYSVDWDGDVSEEGFKHSLGSAVISNKDSVGIASEGIEKYRQITFDNQTTTDDHLMHITGIAKDKNGGVFYLTKNSWGVDRNQYGGYLYMSKAYVQLKTIAILVNKDAVPKEIRKKLGI